MLKLIIENTAIANSVLPIRWCVNKSVLEKLKENKVLYPHILVSLWRTYDNEGGREVKRIVAPLN